MAFGKVIPPLEQLIGECAKTWPPELETALTNPKGVEPAALRSLVECARGGRIATLPFMRSNGKEVYWLSFGGELKSLLEHGEDLRSWVIPDDGVENDLVLVQSGSKGSLARLVDEISPAGYLRWTSKFDQWRRLLVRLARMHAFLRDMPQGQTLLAPSLHVLRFRFVTALRIGQWTTAMAIIDEIDRWNLEQASKTMQMRLRVLGQSGSHSQLLELVERHRLWTLRHPTRVAEAIVGAVVHQVLLPLEATFPPQEVSERIRPWYAKLVSLLPNVAPTVELSTLLAHVACLDKDASAAMALLPTLDEPMAEFVRARFGFEAVNPSALTSLSPEEVHQDRCVSGLDEDLSFWTSLQHAVRRGSASVVREQLDSLDARILDNPDFLVQVPDLLLELISDPMLDEQPGARFALQELLTALVDASVSTPGFPSQKHLDLYLSLAEALVLLRGDTANDEDAHLLHGLLAAISNLSPRAMERCTEILRHWWHQRPIVLRLDWLIGVLESLAPLHPEPHTLLDLWSGAVALATRKRMLLTPIQLKTWERVSRMLEIHPDSAHRDLAALIDHTAEPTDDPLATVGWRKIAIVSLQESAAREAARELENRTGAKVIVVTSLVQDSFTRVAATSDVIFLVWAACSHAVYRAFDDIRERLVYVQGTGTSSIVAAAERWAEQRYAEDHANPVLT